ncbi:MAG: sigma factor-like helix-turn-helix DNA-binding protein, partial [Candidatus Acidiferrales bacterium]
FQDNEMEDLEAPDDSNSQRAENADEYSPEEMLAVVRQGLEDLTPKQREVVQLVCFEGLLLREIAERTKEPLGNVRHHYYRGIAKLKDHAKARFELQEKMRAARGGEK